MKLTLARIAKRYNIKIDFGVTPCQVMRRFLGNIDERSTIELAALAIINDIPMSFIKATLSVLKDGGHNNAHPYIFTRTDRMFRTLIKHLREYQRGIRDKPIQKGYNFRIDRYTYLDGTISWTDLTTVIPTHDDNYTTSSISTQTLVTTTQTNPITRTAWTQVSTPETTQSNPNQVILMKNDATQVIRMEGVGTIFIHTARGTIAVFHQSNSTHINNSLGCTNEMFE